MPREVFRVGAIFPTLPMSSAKGLNQNAIKGRNICHALVRAYVGLNYAGHDSLGFL
jgi:hypothetical protein